MAIRLIKPLLCGKTTARLIWCGKKSTVRQNFSRQTFFCILEVLGEEPPEPKTGTARTVLSPNRNRTELNWGHPVS